MEKLSSSSTHYGSVRASGADYLAGNGGYSPSQFIMNLDIWMSHAGFSHVSKSREFYQIFAVFMRAFQ